MLLKVPQVKLYYRSASLSVDPHELRGCRLCHIWLSLRGLVSVNPDRLHCKWISQLCHIQTAVAAVGAGGWVRSRGERAGEWGSHSKPTEAKGKWCHPCPDYHDSLVSGCALMLPYIWTPGSYNCLGCATVTLSKKALAITFLSQHPFPWFFFLLEKQAKVLQTTNYKSSLSHLSYETHFSALLASCKSLRLAMHSYPQQWSVAPIQGNMQVWWFLGLAQEAVLQAKWFSFHHGSLESHLR